MCVSAFFVVNLKFLVSIRKRNKILHEFTKRRIFSSLKYFILFFWFSFCIEKRKSSATRKKEMNPRKQFQNLYTSIKEKIASILKCLGRNPKFYWIRKCWFSFFVKNKHETVSHSITCYSLFELNSKKCKTN